MYITFQYPIVAFPYQKVEKIIIPVKVDFRSSKLSKYIKINKYNIVNGFVQMKKLFWIEYNRYKTGYQTKCEYSRL